MDTNMINAVVDCDAFIIPNAAAKANLNNSCGRRLATKAAKIAANNGFEYNESVDKFVQLWFVGCSSDNMQDHGFCIKTNGRDYHFGHEISIELIPMKFFEGHKEGEILPLTVTMCPIEEGDEVPIFNITFNIKLNQLNYRYRHFGTFEEVLKMVS